MRHRFIALPIAAFAILALASLTLGGGWAQVTAKEAPVDPPAGGETTINLSVLQHGVTPVSWPRLTVIATDAISGTVVRTDAKAKGPTGAYVASIIFPSAGEWTLTFDSPELVMEGSIAMNVAPVLAAAQTAVATSAAASTFDVVPLLLLLLVAAAIALAIAGLVLRNGRESGAKKVLART
jgi:hypothetical protein